MFNASLRFVPLFLAANLAALPAAHAQSGHGWPGPDSEWQTLGYKAPNQVMIIRSVAHAPDGMPRVEVLFLYSPAEQGTDRIDNFFTIDCNTKKIRDDGGTEWLDGDYLEPSPSETGNALVPTSEGTVHRGMVDFACGTGGSLGEMRKRDTAVAHALDWLKQMQAQ